MEHFGWVANDEALVRAFRKADAAYKRAIANTGALSLEEKISVIRAARLARAAAYDAALNGAGYREA